MGAGPFSSDSKSKQSTANRQVAASDQAVVYQPNAGNKSGNTRTTNRLGAGASLTINNGISPEQFQDFASSLTGQAAANPNSADDQSFKEAVLLSLEQRNSANTAAATDTATAAAPSKIKSWVGYAVAVVVVFGLVVLFRRKS